MAPICVVCGLSNKIMKLCVRCKSIYYCSRECQVRNWSDHKLLCATKSKELRCQGESQTQNSHTVTMPSNKTDASHDENLSKDVSNVCITVKVNKKVHKLDIPSDMKPQDIMKFISQRCSMRVEKLKLIHKGKKVCAENIKEYLGEKAVFLAIGEIVESEEGLDSKDIEVIMSQLSVERNCAIKALRATSGDVVDAILHISNK